MFTFNLKSIKIFQNFLSIYISSWVTNPLIHIVQMSILKHGYNQAHANELTIIILELKNYLV